MGFKEIALDENRRLGGGLTVESKLRIAERSKFYILLKELETKFDQYLEKDETVVGYLPLTLSDNSRVANSGIMGMSYAKTKAARDYVKTFNDVRGNRLLIFTNQRLVFMTIIEFLEEDIYYSYPYTSLHSICLREKVETVYAGPNKSQEYKWYFLDFQSGERIFDEILNEQDFKVFMDMWEKIPAMAKVPRSNRVWRKNLFDRIVSNIDLGVRLGTGISWVAVGAAILIYVIGFGTWFLFNH